jgi:SsrA-binding protein
VKEKGTTIVPLEIYFSGHLVKVLIGLCRGKRQHDKRQAKREASDKREMDRAKRNSRL